MVVRTCGILSVILAILLPSLAAQPASQQKTAAGTETLKNVQVLKGIPEPELRAMMTYIRSSLGVRCDFCHVNSRETGWEYEKDDKENKRTARKMIQMVLDMNKNFFDGRTEVTCYTCHHGRSEPVSVPVLPMESPRFAERPGEEPRRESLPSAEAILAKYREALGGDAALSKLGSRVEKGSVSGPNGQPFPIEVSQKGPDKMVATITMQQGTITRCYDGANAWGVTPRGPMEMSDDDRARLKASADLMHDIDLKKQFESLTTAGMDSIDGRKVYVVRGRVSEGVSERLYFDAETGLLRRRLSISRTMIGILPDQSDFDDYRDVAGIKMPFKVRYSSIDAFTSSYRQFTEITVNVPIDDSKFAMPR
ncbi:MAG TPA: c-type cytochrome [Bacteroidota bacterium]|nr:c-type cytochrome [Bacteroidota bacterium]